MTERLLSELQVVVITPRSPNIAQNGMPAVIATAARTPPGKPQGETMWSQLSDDVQAWDSRPENKNTYAAVLNIIELLQARSPRRYTLASRAAHAPRSAALSISPSRCAAPQPLLRTHRTCAAPQDKAEEAHLSAAATGLLPVLEGAIAADRIPPEHLPAARRALERFHAVQGRAQRVEADALAAERARLTLASDNAAEALLAEEELEAQARHLTLGIGVRVRLGSGT